MFVARNSVVPLGTLVLLVQPVILTCTQEPRSGEGRAASNARTTSDNAISASMSPGPPQRRRARHRPKARPRPKPHPACRFLAGGPNRATAAVKIVDAAHNLDSFFDALLTRLIRRPGNPLKLSPKASPKARPKAPHKASKVRVAFYGDSNATMDWAASYLRRYLGKRFGHGGHGFVTAGKAVPWYQHREIRTWSSRGWKAYCVTNPRHKKQPFYGHAGHISYGRRVGAFAEYASAKSGYQANEVFSRVEIHYLCWPLGGSFEVLVDQKVVRQVQTRCAKRAAKTIALRVVPGRHKVRLKVKKTVVGVFGATFENDQPGVVVDGLGIGALNVKTMRNIKPKLFSAGLAARRYDLVILHTGTNMWGPGFHPGWARAVIDRIRAALGPRTSILVLSPPAFGKWKKGRIQGHKRMAACGREKRDIAAANKIAFWDYFRSMGGRTSVAKWRKSNHIHGDLVHFKPPFHELMMKRLGDALMAHFRAYLRRKGIRCQAHQAQTPRSKGT